MTAGITVYNSNGVLQIDENFKNPRYVSGGFVSQGTDTSGYGGFVINLGSLGIDLSTEIPLILVRPSAYGKYVGGMFVTKQYGTTYNGNYCLLDTSDASFDYAVFSTQVAGVTDSGTYGLQVFDASGQLTYNSNNRHARILTNLYHAATTSYTYPYSFTISGFSAMPWILMNPLVSSFIGGQEEASGVFMKVNSLTSVTVGHQVLGAASGSFSAVYGDTIAATADPYNNRSVSFAMADWA